MMNAGKYNKRIAICQKRVDTDAQGFKTEKEIVILRPWASVKTTRGMTLIQSRSDFEEAYTNFTIRYPHTKITRDMKIKYRDKVYKIEYLNNVNEDGRELEIQAKEVTH